MALLPTGRTGVGFLSPRKVLWWKLFYGFLYELYFVRPFCELKNSRNTSVFLYLIEYLLS